MASFICKQPNGLYCRFSSIVDTVTDYNMTPEQYIEMCAEKAREEARNVLNNHVKPFQCLIDHFVPTNMTRERFDCILKEMGAGTEEHYE